MTKMAWTILGVAAGIALVAAVGLLWVSVFGGGGDGASVGDENEDENVARIEAMRLEEMQPLCVDVTLGILTPDEIRRTTGEADGKPFFHEGAVAEEALGMPYAEISAECTRAVVRGLDASGSYFMRVGSCSEAMWEEGGAEDAPPIERLRRVVACADDAIGIGADGEDAENPDRPKG